MDKARKITALESMLQGSEATLHVQGMQLVAMMKSQIAQIERTLTEPDHDSPLTDDYYTPEARAIRAINDVENMMRNLNLSNLAQQAAEVKARRHAIKIAEWMVDES